MRLRNIYAVLSVIYNLALIAATILAWRYYSLDAGIVVGGFCLTSLSITSAVLSLHFKDDE